MPKIETYWTYEIVCLTGKCRSLVIAPCDTLADALAGAFKDATYYIGVCGYKVAVAFEEHCKHCHGAGCVRRRTFRVPCKKCKGQPIVQTISGLPWLPSENVRILDANF